MAAIVAGKETGAAGLGWLSPTKPHGLPGLFSPAGSSQPISGQCLLTAARRYRRTVARVIAGSSSGLLRDFQI